MTGRIDCDNSGEVIDCIDAEDIEDYELAEAGFVTCKKEVKSFFLFIKSYRGFSPYATFGTWQKVALAKNCISHVCMQ